MTSVATAGTRGVPRAGLVRAAGAVCWRLADGDLQVLLVHRPSYGDWSWPKGKLDAGETGPAAAVREVAEETGLRVRLGIPLPAARYRLSDTLDKQVEYWAAKVTDPDLPDPPHPLEVDRSEWVPAAEAMQRLTRRGDRSQLQAVVDAHAEGGLDTVPLLVLRAAESPARAAALVPLLAAWRPERVLTSPDRRCLETVQPCAAELGAEARPDDRLSEAGYRGDPALVRTLVSQLLDRREAVAVCTHRTVLGTLLGALAGNASAGVGCGIPRFDPFLRPGETLVGHVSARSGRVVATERHGTTESASDAPA